MGKAAGRPGPPRTIALPAELAPFTGDGLVTRGDYDAVLFAGADFSGQSADDAAFLGCRFEWQDRAWELPCLDRRLAAVMDRDGRRIMEVERRSRLLVALTPPIDGHCHKVVEAVLPHP